MVVTRALAGSRDINIRYFLVKDKFKNKNMELHYCPAHLMLVDLFTKPLLGSLYELFGEIIVGKSGIDILFQDSSLPFKEHVENNRIFQAVIENSSMTNG